jgi:hypothetical protein
MLKTKNIRMVSVQDWDELVEKTYARPYSFQQQDGCKSRGVEHLKIPSQAYDFENDTVPEEINGDEMGVSFKAWLERDPNEWNGEAGDHMFLDLFWERNFYPSIEMIANDLLAKGLLEAGEYTIEIDW